MARPAITDAQVKSITGQSGVNTALHIKSAKDLLDNLKLESKGLSEELITTIETWLAAHFLATTDQSKNIGGEVIDKTNVSYNAKTGVAVGLKNSRFGQMAISLDPTNTLGRLDSPPFEFVGI